MLPLAFTTKDHQAMSDFMSEHWRVLLGVAVMLLGWWRLSRKPITLKISEASEPIPDANTWEPPLLSDMLPGLAHELQQLLIEQDEPELAAQVPGLRIVDRCRCGDDFCATFYVQPRPKRAYGPDHRNVPLTPKEGMLILDVVGEKIVEVLYRDDVRKVIQAI
jgi:hypothetical protein